MINRTALVIYHSPCLDGFTSAWVAKQALGNTAEYKPGTYNNHDQIPDVTNKIVYMLDFCYSIDIMRKIAALAKEVIVLDHHKSAEEDLKELLEDGTINGEFDMNRSGAMITWDYFFPDREALEFITYVQDRDLWRFLLPHSKEVNIAMFSYEYNFDDWDRIAAMPITELQREGDAIWRKHMKDVNELTNQVQYMTIGGFENVPTVNANYFYGSDLGSVLSQDQPFSAYYWINREGEYVFGLRSCVEFEGATDVSSIAKLYGGGGHANASGFRIKDLSEL